MEPLDHQQGDQGFPNLNEKSVFALSDEGFHLRILLPRLEEEFDPPPVLANRAYRARSELEMIGQKDYLLVVLLQGFHDDPPKLPGVVLRSRYGDEGGHVVVVAEKHVNFDAALGSPEVRPRKERQAEADRRRVEGHQLVLEAELALPAPERRYGAEMTGQLPEQSLEEFRRAMIVSVGESRSLGRIIDLEMYELPVAAGQIIDYRIRSREMTKEHGDKLRLGPESFGMTLRAEIGDQIFKVHGGKDLRKYLTEQTRKLYHNDSLLGGFEILLLCGESMISQKHRGLFNFPQSLFWTRVISQNGLNQMTTTLTSGILAVSHPSENLRRIVVMENRTTTPEVLEAAVSEIVRTNGKIFEEDIGETVRSAVEETLNGLLDAPCGSHLRRGAQRTKPRQGGHFA